MSHDWIQLLASAVLEDGPQLQGKSYWREKAKVLQHQGRVSGSEASQDQIIGEGPYTDPDSQAIYNEHILLLCHTAASNVWGKIQEHEKELNHVLRLYKAHENPF